MTPNRSNNMTTDILAIARNLQAVFTTACAAITDERAECDQLADVHTALVAAGAASEEYAHTGGNIYVSYTIHAAGTRMLLCAATFEVFTVVLLPRAYSATDIDAAQTFLYDFCGDESSVRVLQVLPYSTPEEAAGIVGAAATQDYSFAEFQATRERCDDIREASSHCIEEAMPGFVYACGMYIAECALNTYWLLIGAHVDETSNDLATLERKLYDYAVESNEIRVPTDIEIFYTSTGENSGVMPLEELIRNFNAHGGWELSYCASAMREQLSERGWYQGAHDCGNYLVLNLAKLGLCVTLDIDADKLDAAIAAKRAGGAA
jgi:hypothetical protein